MVAMIKIGVVIPFFQERSGVLERAIRSVLRQELPRAEIRIIVIDDGSPIAPDLHALDAPRGFTIEYHRQHNAGPASARNAALDLLAKDPPAFVAFLDSDDEWVPGHLSRSIGVLGQDADFYGADHRRSSGDESATFLSQGTEARHVLEMLGEKMSEVEGPDVFLLHGAKALEAFVRNYLVQTSTVVYRWAVLQDVRFDVGLRSAGEDNLFWLECAARARALAVDTTLAVRCLDGVNIYEGASSWHSSDNVRRLGFLLLMWISASRRFGSDPQVRRALARRRRNFERAYSFMWARSIIKRQEFNLANLRLLTAADPYMPIRLVPALCLGVWHRIVTGRASFADH
jgi:succinoglycan biosynthesis protein ExoW